MNHRLHDLQIVGGPDWVDSDRFDITAKMEGNLPPGPETANLSRMMLRALLVERFQLEVRTESRELPVYALAPARPDSRLGPGLRPRQDSCEPFVPPTGGPDDRIVIDQTRLQGLFDIDLTWAVDASASADAPSIFTAVEEQLGLKLEPARAPMEVLVITHVEKPTPD